MRPKINPDKNIVKTVRDGIKNKNGHCPCVIEVSEDTKCPCKKMREEHVCCCELYIFEEKFEE